MRTAETVLGILRERGRRGLPLERVYRLLFNRNLYLLAYGKIARNHGALTPGATRETCEGAELRQRIRLLARKRDADHPALVVIALIPRPRAAPAPASQGGVSGAASQGCSTR
jgi:hypothetical protein